MSNTLFKELSFPIESTVEVKNNLCCVTKWNWDYKDYLNFQASALKFIQKNRKLKIYIFCNHPNVFTLGYGNERGNNGLVDFNSDVKLPFPLYKIHRGGGITFHHPGQWIFYPIVNISENYSLENLMCELLQTTKHVLESAYGISELLSAKKLMGIWHQKSKLASIGMGLSRFVSEHGIALNLFMDEQMHSALKAIHPCGLSSEIYKSVSDIIKPPTEFHQDFQTHFLSLIDLDKLSCKKKGKQCADLSITQGSV